MAESERTDQRSRSIRNWLKLDCAQPLVLWAGQPAIRLGDEVILPNMNGIGADYLTLPSLVQPIRAYRFDELKYFSDGGSLYRTGKKFDYGNIVPSRSDLTTDEPSIDRIFDGERHGEVASAFVLLHNPYPIYGHFLLEMAPKLLVYEYMERELPELQILLGWYTPKFILDWIEMLRPGAPKIFLKRAKHTVVRQSYYCDMLLDRYLLGDAFFEFIRMVKNRVSCDTESPRSEKIFISRINRRNTSRDFRTWENEGEICSALASEGFTVVQPETLSIASQIRLFDKAKIVVGELSSALHNTIFCRPGTIVVQVNPFNAVQRRISLGLGHRLVSILPIGGELSGWPPKDGKSSFKIDLSTILSAIKSS